MEQNLTQKSAANAFATIDRNYRLFLKEYFRRNYTTLAQAGQAIGCDASSLGRVLNGHRSLTFEMAATIIEIYDIKRLPLFFAVEIRGEPTLYFDRFFRATIDMIEPFWRHLVALENDTEDIDYRALLASVNPKAFDRLGREQAKRFQKQLRKAVIIDPESEAARAIA